MLSLKLKKWIMRFVIAFVVSQIAGVSLWLILTGYLLIRFLIGFSIQVFFTLMGIMMVVTLFFVSLFKLLGVTLIFMGTKQKAYVI
jgi:hypothetical protein